MQNTTMIQANSPIKQEQKELFMEKALSHNRAKWAGKGLLTLWSVCMGYTFYFTAIYTCIGFIRNLR